MTTLPTLQEMMTAGVHFGHRASKWYPKMAQYIFGVKSGVHVMDLEKTQAALTKATKAVTEVVAEGGQVVFVCTKKQCNDVVKKNAESCHMPYVRNRWLGGTLTNYGIIKKQIERLAQIKADQASGGLDKYTKKERLGFEE
ncbi:MAG: 30S ribosomal protein S2, partial [Parcubacteria group bacterium GW2011_GWA2_44_15]